MRRGFAEGQLTGAINDIDEVSGHDTGCALTLQVERPDLLDVWHGVQGPSQAQSIPGLAKREEWTPALMCLTSSDEIGLKRLRTPTLLPDWPRGGQRGTVTGYEVKPATGGFP